MFLQFSSYKEVFLWVHVNLVLARLLKGSSKCHRGVLDFFFFSPITAIFNYA